MNPIFNLTPHLTTACTRRPTSVRFMNLVEGRGGCRALGGCALVNQQINLASEEIKRMKRRVHLLSLVLSLMVSAVGSSQTASPANQLGENKLAAPNFSVTSLEGEKFELAALRGKVVVLNFWFTGCAPCVAE